MHTYKVNTGHEAALEREVARLKELLIEREDKWDDAMNENRQLQNKIGELKSTCAVLEGRIDEMRDSAFGNNNTISHLKEKYEEAKTNMALMTDELEKLRREKEASSAPCGCQAYHDIEEERATLEKNVQYLRDERERLKSELDELSKAYKDSTHEEITMKKAWREQRELVALRDDQIAMLERRLAKYTGEKVYPFKEGDIYYVFNQLDGTWIESVWDDESERIHDSAHIPSRPHRVYFTVDQKNVLDKFNPVADLREDMEDQTKLVDDLRYHINAFMAAVEETIDL